jgi:hypothetical protein
VTGIVRDAITRAPIAGAKVSVGAFNHEWCDPCSVFEGLASVTDSAGRFAIDDAPQIFVLEAGRTGYAVGGFGVRRPVGRAARIDLAPGQRLDGLEILLFREAVITGRVTDETGAPVAGLTVELSRIDARGRWTLPSWTRSEGDPYRPVTDATGYYTAHVAPDEYAVAAIRAGVPGFHPAEDQLQAAALVTVDPGEVLAGIDVHLPARRVGSVRGHFQVPADQQSMSLHPSIRLRNARFEVRGRFDGDSFVVENVPYGDYSLEITASRFSANTVQGNPSLEWWARVPVRVDAAAVELEDVPAQRALIVSGVVTSPGAKTAEDRSATRVRLNMLDDDDSCGRNPSWDSVANGGEFTLKVMPGNFRMCAWPRNGFGRGEATLNGQDLVDVPFTVSEDVRGVQVFQSTNPAHLRGMVHGRDGRPVREGWVVVFPSDRRYWRHAVAEGGRFAAARVSVAGAFEIDSLLPAEYFVAAVDDPSIDGWPIESWLAGAAEGAVRATIQRSQTRTLSSLRLRTVPVERAPVREHRRVIAAQRPSFAGAWALDVARSSSTGGGRGQVDTPGGGRGGGLGLGPSAESLDVRQTSDLLSIEERRGRETARIVYRFDRSESIQLPAGQNAGAEASALSRWEGNRLVTTITLPATAVGGAMTYEETRWLEADGTMVVETRRPGEPNLRRTLYRRTR